MSEHVGFTSRETGIIERATVAAREQGRQEMRVEFLAAIEEERAEWLEDGTILLGQEAAKVVVETVLDRLRARVKEGK